MQRFTIDLNGPLHGIDYGGEGRPVLLVHGLSGAGVNWSEIGSSLTGLGRVLAPDLPGFGRTPPAGRKPTVTASADLLAEFIEWMGGGPALVIGNSMGGLIGMILAARRPELVERLVLICPAGHTPRLKGLSASWTTTMLLYLIPGINSLVLMRMSRCSDPENSTDASLDYLASRPGRMSVDARRLHAGVTRERRQVPWAAQTYLAAFRSVITQVAFLPRFSRMVRRIKAPTLLIHGINDTVVPISAAEQIVHLRPDWAYRPLAETGHIPMLDSPNLVLDLITEHSQGSAVSS